MKKDGKKQNILIFLCWLLYTASYVSRYSYNSNIVAIKDCYGITNAETGLVSTFFFFAYGAGQIINGLLCKKYSKKLFLTAALAVSAIINFVLFTLPPIEYYKYLWMVNGMALSVLWSLLILTLSENLDEQHLIKAMVVMSSTVASGTVISYGTSALFNYVCGFRYAFLLGGIAASAAAAVWLFSCDKVTGLENAPRLQEQQNTVKKKADKYLIGFFVLFGLFMLIDNLVKDGTGTWVPQILKDTYSLDNGLSIILTIVLPLLGLLSAVLLARITKTIKKEKVLAGVLFGTGGALILSILFLIKCSSFVPVVIAFGLLSVVMHALNGLITSYLPLTMRDRVNSGVMAGVLNGCGYVGSTVSAYCLGVLADSNGWNGVLVLLMALCFAAFVLALVFSLREYVVHKYGK